MLVKMMNIVEDVEKNSIDLIVVAVICVYFYFIE
jgi:hypothetical protein